MAQFDTAWIQEGTDAARDRARLDLPGYKDVHPAFQTFVEDVLKLHPEDLSERFVRLFTELCAIATISRETYQEPRLTTPDASDFLKSSASFLNSWKHK